VSDPTNPIKVGGVAFTASGANMVISGKYAYVGTTAAGTDYNIHIIDISDPSDPSSVGGYAFPGAYTNTLAVAGNYLYTATYWDTDKLFVLDISSSTNPFVVHEAPLSDESRDLQISGSYLYVVNDNNGDELNVFDIGALEVSNVEAGQIKTDSLEEINTAMKVLLKKRDEDKIDMEDNVLTNIKELIVPYIRKMKNTELDDQQVAILNVIESNLNEIISPFTRKMSVKYINLTPQEIRITNLIKQGNSTKKIAKLLNLSPRTVETHRKNIRSKIGLEGKKANLRSHLLSLD
jgi:DNA-binding CsgD family transcriptional regulator